MKVERIMEKAVIAIILFLYEEEEVRYTDLTELIASRGTLTNNMQSLDEENLIQRRIEPTKPIKSFYSLTEKGKKIAKHLKEVKRILS